MPTHNYTWLHIPTGAMGTREYFGTRLSFLELLKKYWEVLK